MRRFGGLAALAALGTLSAATYAGALSAAAWLGVGARTPPRRLDPSPDQPPGRADDLPACSPMALRRRGCAGAWVRRRLAPAAVPLRRRDGRDALTTTTTTTAAARRAADGRDH